MKYRSYVHFVVRDTTRYVLQPDIGQVQLYPRWFIEIN